jgi:hypothetical protein
LPFDEEPKEIKEPEGKGNSKKERLQLSRDAKPKPLTKKERKEKRLKKRNKEISKTS